MKKLVSLVLIVFLCISCMTQKRHDRICAACPIVTEVVTIKDTSWSKTTIVHDTIYKSVAGPTITLENPCAHLCDSAGRLKKFSQETKLNGITQKLYTDTKNNKLIQECDADKLKIEVDKLTVENNHLRTEKQVKVLPPVEINVLSWWQKLMIKSGYLFWIILISVVGYKIFKIYRKLPLP